jgi:hypothetical protein
MTAAAVRTLIERIQSPDRQAVTRTLPTKRERVIAT